MILYHITPNKNVNKVLREGLKPTATGSGFSKEMSLFPGEEKEHESGIYFFKSIEQMLDELGIGYTGQSIKPENWSVIEASISDDYQVEEFNEGYPPDYPQFFSLRVQRTIPPCFLRNLGNLSKFVNAREKRIN